MKNMKKYIFLFLILLAFLSINSVSADFNYYTNIEVTEFEGTSATFPIYLVDRIPDFNNNGFIDNEDKLYFKQHQYALINYDCVKEDGSDIVAYMNGNIVPQKLDSFKINQLSENKIIVKGTTNEPTITLNIQYIDLNSTSHMISETVNVENTNYYYEMSTENIKDNSEINIEIPQKNTNIQGIINKKPIILSKLYVKITETGTLAVKFDNDNPPTPETITVQKNYCNYFIDNDVLTAKIIDIPASSTTNVYIEETSNPVIVSSPTQVFDFYCDASTYDANDWTWGYGATTTIANNRVYLNSNQDKGNMHTKTMYTHNTRLKMNGQIIKGTYFGFINDYRLEAGTLSPKYQYIYTDYYYSRYRQFYYESGVSIQYITDDISETNNDRLFTIDWYSDKIVSSADGYSVYKDKTMGNTQYVIYRLDTSLSSSSSMSFKYLSVQKIDKNVEITKIFEDNKLKAFVKNNNNYALNNYQIDINISDLNSPNYVNVYTTTLNEDPITSNSNIDYYSTGYQNEVDYPSIVKVGQSFELIINGELPTTTIVNWGDGSSNTMNSNTITHSYSQTGNYIITITYNNEITKNYDITVQEIEYINYLVNFYYEDNSTKFNDSLVINTENLNKNTNDSINVSLPENSLIVVSYNNVVRSVYTSENSIINIYMPSKTSYLSQVRLSSYYDDKITVKSTDNKIICENTKELNTYLMTGKVYKIYINDVFYKDLTVDGAKDISLPYSNSNTGLEIHATQNDKCVIIYGKSSSEETLKVEFKSNYGNYTNNYKITSDMTIIQIDKSTIIDNINNTPNQFKVDLKIYDSSNKLIQSETMVLINNKITENTNDSKLFSLVIALVILITLLIVPKSYFHMSLLMAGGVFAILSVYLENNLSIITVGFFTGLAIVYFIKSKMGK
ncbi:hypothetical protein M2325_000665 [Methanococcus voltae PS]|uniref:PKD domain-containing protein n=1 Tax=Methanococcus voltae PS TaxID=523842 RepID=A0ABT2EVK1_METVO|nr:hypothetical protein [Methanococcus voltae]MCS3921980.1 hypothetical protein [Methanococcus voltae PS]